MHFRANLFIALITNTLQDYFFIRNYVLLRQAAGDLYIIKGFFMEINDIIAACTVEMMVIILFRVKPLWITVTLYDF